MKTNRCEDKNITGDLYNSHIFYVIGSDKQHLYVKDDEKYGGLITTDAVSMACQWLHYMDAEIHIKSEEKYKDWKVFKIVCEVMDCYLPGGDWIKEY